MLSAEQVPRNPFWVLFRISLREHYPEKYFYVPLFSLNRYIFAVAICSLDWWGSGGKGGWPNVFILGYGQTGLYLTWKNNCFLNGSEAFQTEMRCAPALRCCTDMTGGCECLLSPKTEECIRRLQPLTWPTSTSCVYLRAVAPFVVKIAVPLP